MKIKLLLILILLCSIPAFAEPFGDVFSREQNLGTIVKGLPELKNTSCKFTQDKFLPASNIHLKSSGDLKFEKDKGAVFYTTYPVKTTVSYTSGEYKQINTIIKAIANKNYSRLESEFKFYYANSASLWVFGLKPKANSKTANYISYIQIFGNGDDISKIAIETKDKTKTVINFSR